MSATLTLKVNFRELQLTFSTPGSTTLSKFCADIRERFALPADSVLDIINVNEFSTCDPQYPTYSASSLLDLYFENGDTVTVVEAINGSGATLA
mmetsp:Transcript_8654/g.11958  ORF Transcript_8654/g.11958 Transcript_8654/m.11958 type:complete len:94 (+) Transcript_8654:77-358(+)